MHPSTLEAILERVGRAATAAGSRVRLLAVSKRQPDVAVERLAQQGQLAFGENYVQALCARRRQAVFAALEWHLIGPLQSNKIRLAALNADWVQSVDRADLVGKLARHRAATQPALNVLVQVNVDAEPGKSGCTAAEVAALCARIAMEPRLVLRGLMAIPRPDPERSDRRSAFAAMRALFERTRDAHPGIDTLSMGMSEDFELAIAEGATLVRVGTALFGERAG